MDYPPSDDPCPIPDFYASFAPPAPLTEPLDASRRVTVAIVGAGGANEA